ncbi:bifunctional hydroxymethylpyrimidine kinase/phosphomethylpyrimidine kinase [Desulfurococcaceae archaeon AG1]|jgi:hydroxymethylpyrimidine kinase/phosphomethylpyrimidine kinase|nr:bifunctional hydroxymethylpyrimidine kinase/phosphomethylpyrimidine kinase [Desulfurococcaceae archaeon AG1]
MVGKPQIPRALTIAGVDSGGGAGIAADLKTFAALQVHGLVAVTSVTAQNTLGVFGIHDIPPSMVELQIDVVAEDIGVDAAKTGMLSNPGIVRSVARSVKKHGFPLVVDPVIFAKSGDRLLVEEAVEVMAKELLPLAKVVTPNKFEAERLSGIKIEGLEDAEKAGKIIREKYGPEIVVVKGGHLSGDKSIDIVIHGSGNVTMLEGPRVDGCTHGTGCSFSAAIAAYIAKGEDLLNAVKKAKEFVTIAIERSYKVGKGHCPVNPTAYLELDAERYRAERLVEEAIAIIEKRAEDVAKLIPEVQSNLAYALPHYLAKSPRDVIAIPGRIVNYMGRAKASGPPRPGASSHVARGVLAAMEIYPEYRAAMNIRYIPGLEDIASKAGFKISWYDRREEPEDVKRKEGASIPWGVRTAINRIGSMPDIIIDYGDFGKEPGAKIFGKDPIDVVNKLLRLIEELKRNKTIS